VNEAAESITTDDCRNFISKVEKFKIQAMNKIPFDG
jgi:hypothetical protein